MVKVLKPSPKSFKKDISEKVNKPIKKKCNVASSKQKLNKRGNTLDLSNSEVVNVGKQKKTKKVQNNVGNTVPKKKQIVPKVEKTTVKENPLIEEASHKLEKVVKKKSSNAAKVHKKTSIVSKTAKKSLLKLKVGIKNKPGEGVVKQSVKEKKESGKENIKAEEDPKKITSPQYEPINFEEEKFNNITTLENIKEISEALKVLVEKEVAKKKTSIFSDYRYFLNVTCFKIASCPKRMVKLNIEHSLVNTETDDVVMIVPDLKRGAKVDYEPTIQHYEDLLREIGVDNIKIVPFNQLRKEYSSFEAKQKFAKTYDYFLCDGRIVSHVGGFCGSNFQKPRTTIHAVHLNNPQTYKRNIEHALKRTAYRQLHKGDLISIPVGNHLFTTTQLAENIAKVIQQLKTLYPGGYANIRQIFLRIDIKGTSALPIYVNLGDAPAEVPNIIGPREQKMNQLKKQANVILSKFNMTKTGDFVKLNIKQVRQKKKLQKARTALLSKENEVVENNSECISSSKKKFKKGKQIAAHNDTDEDEGEL